MPRKSMPKGSKANKRPPPPPSPNPQSSDQENPRDDDSPVAESPAADINTSDIEREEEQDRVNRGYNVFLDLQKNGRPWKNKTFRKLIPVLSKSWPDMEKLLWAWVVASVGASLDPYHVDVSEEYSISWSKENAGNKYRYASLASEEEWSSVTAEIDSSTENVKKTHKLRVLCSLTVPNEAMKGKDELLLTQIPGEKMTMSGEREVHWLDPF